MKNAEPKGPFHRHTEEERLGEDQLQILTYFLSSGPLNHHQIFVPLSRSFFSFFTHFLSVLIILEPNDKLKVI